MKRPMNIEGALVALAASSVLALAAWALGVAPALVPGVLLGVLGLAVTVVALS